MDVWSPDHQADPLERIKKDWTEKKALQITTGGIRPGQGKSPFSS
jgi:hypothetical protein